MHRRFRRNQFEPNSFPTASALASMGNCLPNTFSLQIKNTRIFIRSAAHAVPKALPNAGSQTLFAENIENNRSDTVTIVDVRVDKAFTFGGKYRLTMMADLFNTLNSNAVSNFNLLNGGQYNRIIATLDPRTFQLGFRFDF